MTAHTELVGDNAKTTFSFSAESSMEGATFLYYAENDIFGFADDVADFGGSIAGGNLVLAMYDSLAISGGSPGLSVLIDATTVGDASLTLFGSDLWTGFGTALEGGDLSVLSSDGSNFNKGPGDLGLVLAFSLFGTEAEVTVNYFTEAEIPDLPSSATVPLPASALLLAVALGVIGCCATRPTRG